MRAGTKSFSKLGICPEFCRDEVACIVDLVVRKLNLWNYFALGFGTMIGTGRVSAPFLYAERNQFKHADNATSSGSDR